MPQLNPILNTTITRSTLATICVHESVCLDDILATLHCTENELLDAIALLQHAEYIFLNRISAHHPGEVRVIATAAGRTALKTQQRAIDQLKRKRERLTNGARC